MVSEWKAQYQQEPIPVIDCNDCKNISITEAEQRKIGNNIPHICQIYKKRCKHNTIKRGAMFIYPCEECCCDKFKNFSRRCNNNLVEYAEKISPIPLTDWQKKFLEFYEQAKKEYKPIVCITPRISGRKMLIQIIQEFEKEMEECYCRQRKNAHSQRGAH